MDKSRSKYFSIYATWNDGCKTSYGKVSEWLHWSFRRYQLCSKYSCELRWSIQYVVPQFLKRRSSRVENNPSIEHSDDDSTSGGKTISTCLTACWLWLVLCAIIGSMSWWSPSYELFSNVCLFFTSPSKVHDDRLPRSWFFLMIVCSPPRLLKSLRCNPDVRPTCACSGGRNIRSKWTKRT
jgi:hypothetical protein